MVLLVDGSGSIKDQDPNNWEEMMNFLKGIFDRVDINQVKAAVVDFSNYANVFFNLDNNYRTASDYKNAIDTTIAKYYQGGDTNTAIGLDKVRTEVLMSAGNRGSVRDVVIVLTDGHPTIDVERLPDAARQVRDFPALVVAIGVTDKVNVETLRLIASGDDYVFQVQRFDELFGQIDNILQEACKQVVPTPAPTPTPQPTMAPVPSFCDADIIFIIDSSGSIRDKNVEGGPDNWNQTLKFVQQVINTVVAKPSASPRFAAVTFSNFGELQFNFDEYGVDYTRMGEAVLSSTYLGGTTNTTGGFLVAEKFLLGAGNGGNRPEAKDLIILITDGTATVDADKLQPTAARIRDRSVDILGVGVTDDRNEEEIRGLISDQAYYFTAVNFNDLTQTAREVADIVCPP